MEEEILTLTRDQLAELKKRFSHSGMVLEESYVRVSEDRMEAWLYLAEPSETGERYKVDELLEMLREEGVTTGYVMSRLVAMSKKGVYQREILVAKGKAVVEGKDGYYKYFFTPDEISTAPAIREDGSVDYSSMSMLQSVKAGDALAEYYPAVGGEDGYDVEGNVLKKSMIKELPPLRGINIERRGNVYYAKTAGKIEMKNGNIDIRMVHEIIGDVDLNNGKIEFFGDVTISGNVSAGVIIRAGRNLVIEGTVESADLFAGGNIVLKRGIQGNMKGRVRSRGNIFANFLEQCDVKAELNVEANYILNANVKADGMIIVSGRRGSIIGGKVAALQGIEAYQLGNPAEVRTIVHSGYEKEIYDRYTSCVKREKELKDQLQDVLESMRELIKRKQFQGAASGNTLMLLNGKKDEYFKQLDEVMEKIEDCRARIEKGKGTRINAEGTTYKGVILSIENYSKQAPGGIERTTYRCIGGEIVSEVYHRLALTGKGPK